MSDMGVAPTYTDGSGRPQRAQGVFGEITLNADTPAESIYTRGMGFTSVGVFTPAAAAYSAGMLSSSCPAAI